VTTAGVLTDPCGSVVAWPKDPYSGDLSPWPVPADPGQRRMQHPIT
jgi:hypothetical protein